MGLHIVPCLTAFISLGLSVAGLYFAYDGTGVYEITYSYPFTTGVNVEKTLVNGIIEVCDTTCITITATNNRTCAAAVCTEPLITTNCTGQKNAREKWVLAEVALYASGGVQLILMFTIVGNGASLALARILMSTMGFIGYCCFVTAFTLYFYYWIGCEQALCDEVKANLGDSATCTQSFIWPFWLLIGASGVSLITAILSCVAKTQSTPEGGADSADEEKKKDGGESGQADNTANAGNGNENPDDTQAQRQAPQDDSEAQQAHGDEHHDDGSKDHHHQEDERNETAGNPSDGNENDGNPAAGDTSATEGGEEEDGDLYPLPPGEWAYDEDSGLWWSDEQWMYFDRYSGQYYDPESNMWYSDEIGEWYSAEDYEYEEEGYE